MKKILTSIFIVIALIIFGNISNAASDFELNSIKYDVVLNTDGSMDVTETWKINVHSLTNTLFKTFTLDKTRYSGITDVKVGQISSMGQITEFIEKNEEVLHVDKNCYYGLINSNGQYEIAWGINENSGRKTYQISYKVNDCIKKYNDTAELYWQFIGSDFGVNIDQITGTVSIPNYSEDKTTTRAWAHGPLNGNIEIESADKVNFDLDYFDEGNYLEIRLAMPPEIFETKTINTNRMDTIISEETILADEANNIREEYKSAYQREKEKEQKISIVAQIIAGLLSILFLTKIGKYSSEIKENKKIVPENKSKYYREIPDEKATPAEAAFLYYYGKTGIENNLPKVLSSTILDLAMKKFLEFEVIDTKKKNEQIKIKLINKNEDELKSDEKIIYNLLKKVQGDKDGFNMKELEKYAQQDYKVFLDELERIPDKTKKQIEQEGMYDVKTQQKGQKWVLKAMIYVVGIIYSFIVMALSENTLLFGALFVLSLVCTVMSIILATRFKGITQKGLNEKEKWCGLKRYMEDYSMIDDREVPELAIWEKYLVYATTFGIADKVLKQLKIQYPEIEEGNITNSTYLNAMYYNGLNLAMLNSINNSVEKAYNTGVSQRATEYNYSNTSSGGGFGGGFSGGGGFGGGGAGRRWRRRKIKARKNEKIRGKMRNKAKTPHIIKPEKALKRF